jgi:hypothetical protein
MIEIVMKEEAQGWAVLRMPQPLYFIREVVGSDVAYPLAAVAGTLLHRREEARYSCRLYLRAKAQ